MSEDLPEDRIRVFPPHQVAEHEIALEVEIHGAWVDGTYEPAAQRSPAVVQAIRVLYELALEHRKQQEEETG